MQADETKSIIILVTIGPINTTTPVLSINNTRGKWIAIITTAPPLPMTPAFTARYRVNCQALYQSTNRAMLRAIIQYRYKQLISDLCNAGKLETRFSNGTIENCLSLHSYSEENCNKNAPNNF